jgi:hypothetical protein
MALLVGKWKPTYWATTEACTGYTANASAISITGTSGATTSETSSSTDEHLIRAAELVIEEATSTPSQRDPAIVAATAFYLVSKAMRIIFHL